MHLGTPKEITEYTDGREGEGNGDGGGGGGGDSCNECGGVKVR